ncbi:ATP-binding protein [Pseudomonas sp. D2-3]
MSEASLKFDGKLIGELSQKIPSSLFALNELIKNAYDAFSPDVKINIDSTTNSVTISDSGIGMGAQEIENLFHISRSSKRFGHTIEKDGVFRITQGSKGLGFLAAFKFGDKVTWVTSKNGVRSTFSLKKSDLIAKSDLAGTKIPIVTEPNDGKGTTITINSSESDIQELLEDLGDEKVSEKLVAAILDETFNIVLEVGGKISHSTNRLKNFKSEVESNQLFYVDYKTESNDIEFYHEGRLLKTVPGLSESMRTKEYSINLELIIFYFGPGKKSTLISPLNRRVHDGALYPLVYFNRNLFNNIVLFDPELLRKSSSGSSLPQMIGRVNLISQSEDIEFNSDRTNFVENSMTKELAKNLKYLNDVIQTEGSRLKKELQENTGKKLVPTGKAAPVSGAGEPKKTAASISINRKLPLRIYIPSHQIELASYIFQVKNSLGLEVDKSDVQITVDGEILSAGILPSIEEPCEKRIGFRYQDPHTSLVFTEILLSFDKKVSNVTGVPQDNSLFTIESESGYCITQGVVSSLISAIDKVYQSKSREEYLPLIACSIRCIFEISCAKLSKAKPVFFGKSVRGHLVTVLGKSSVNSALRKELNAVLVFDVICILFLLKKNQWLLTELSEISGITFTTLNNLIDLTAFLNAVKLSNVGAHSSSSYLSKPKIEECANKGGLFAVVCDALARVDEAKFKVKGVARPDSSDFEAWLGR